LHDAGGFCARFCRPAFGDQCRAGGPLTADAYARQETEDRQFLPAAGDAAEASERSIDQDRNGHGFGAAVPIGDGTEDKAAERPTDHEDAEHDAAVESDLRALAGAEQIAHCGKQDDCIEIAVHDVEGPAEARANQHAPLVSGDLAVPFGFDHVCSALPRLRWPVSNATRVA